MYDVQGIQHNVLDHDRNSTNSSLVHNLLILQISLKKSTRNFFIELYYSQTNGQTDNDTAVKTEPHQKWWG